MKVTKEQIENKKKQAIIDAKRADLEDALSNPCAYTLKEVDGKLVYIKKKTNS